MGGRCKQQELDIAPCGRRYGSLAPFLAIHLAGWFHRNLFKVSYDGTCGEAPNVEGASNVGGRPRL